MNRKIGIVCEGITDHHVIEAALNAIVPGGFILTLLQPDATPQSEKFGQGWCGVFKWCGDILSHEGSQTRMIKSNFDIIIIHIDADVAQKDFADCGLSAQGLPCDSNCPPAEDTVNNLKDLLESWMPNNPLDDMTVFCIPSICTEAWVATALYGTKDPAILTDIECNSHVETFLAGKPARERLIFHKAGNLKKRTDRYRNEAEKITGNWNLVTQHCGEAKKFEENVIAILALSDL